MATSLAAINASQVSTFYGGISNSGTISAAGAFGILALGSSTFSGGISNSGSVAAHHGGVDFAFVDGMHHFEYLLGDFVVLIAK